MPLPAKLVTVLDSVKSAQAIIDEQTEQIGRLLDEALQQNGGFDHLSLEELNESILALPGSCFYRVYLMSAWRKRRESSQPNN